MSLNIHKTGLAIVLRVAIVLMLISTVGCSQFSVKSEAFGKTKKFAIVSIFTTPDIVNKSNNNNGGTLSGLVMAATTDSGYSRDSSKIFEETLPLIVAELKKSTQYKLLPESSVLHSKAYVNAKSSEPKVLFMTLVPAKGYKYFDNEDDIKALAKSLQVDAVIIVNISYGYTFSGVSMMGLVAAGTHSASVTIALSAMDQQGSVVWKDLVVAPSADSIGAFGESANFVKLHPLLISATKDALAKVSENMEKAL